MKNDSSTKAVPCLPPFVRGRSLPDPARKMMFLTTQLEAFLGAKMANCSVLELTSRFLLPHGLTCSKYDPLQVQKEVVRLVRRER